MLNNIFSSIITNGSFTAAQLGIVTVTSLICGLIISMAYSIRNKCSRSFTTTLIMLPAIVELVIILVNGNIGAGVAVAGAFTLVRFRSMPGTAREIAAIFVDMAVGLACGMGYIVLAVIFFVVIAAMVILLTLIGFGDKSASTRQLKITIPENLDYNDLFDDLFEKYTTSQTLTRVRTSNMGTLYELTYDVVLKDSRQTKAFMDEIRCRNGNLNISLGRVAEHESL